MFLLYQNVLTTEFHVPQTKPAGGKRREQLSVAEEVEQVIH